MVYPLRMHSPVLRMYVSMINFRIRIEALLVVTLGMLITKRSLIGPTEVHFKVGHKDISSKKVLTIQVTENIPTSVHIKHPHKIIKGTLP